MQLNKLIIKLILLNVIKLMESVGAKIVDDTSIAELKLHSEEAAGADENLNDNAPSVIQHLPSYHHTRHPHHNNHPHHLAHPSKVLEKRRGDHYDYRHIVAEGVQKALDECREKFKWERWNCPKKAFLDVLDRNPLPANKELGLTRALIASGIVLALTKTCSYGSNQLCGCSQPTAHLLTGPTSAQIWPSRTGENSVVGG